jgi:cell fate regulator YaaT (PSP1 superfamily)
MNIDDLDDENIFELEDNLPEQDDIIVVVDPEALAPDEPVYRLRLFYSFETFLATYKGKTLAHGDMVFVPTRYGRDLAQVIGPVQQRTCTGFSNVVHIERIASEADLARAQINKTQEKQAFALCKQKIIERKLDMKLVSVHFLLEESKILFFFTSDKRVDFRELVKDLVSVFKMRIELRQIGIRDESRIVGGLGVCGRGYCCHSISDQLSPVSIKMAKDQNLSLNSAKISGPCGRLLCCLAYEYPFYCEQRKVMPQESSTVYYKGSLWTVLEINVISGTVKISCDDGRQLHIPIKSFQKHDERWYIVGNIEDSV